MRSLLSFVFVAVLPAVAAWSMDAQTFGLSDDRTAETLPYQETLAINQIQGSGETSPYEGVTVRAVGVVATAVGPDGFFIQTMDGSPQDDHDRDTSEGLYVYTGPTPSVAVGDVVEVVGEVQEYYGLTELYAPDEVRVLHDRGTIPTAVLFDASVPSPDPEAPSCAIEYECYEGMLVEASGMIVGPTQSFGTDLMGEFLGVATGQRTFREVGAEYPGMDGLPPAIPIWDGNPEIFEVDSDRLGEAEVLGYSGDSYSAFGPLGYEFEGWEIWASEPVIITSGLPVPRAVRPAGPDEMTIGSLNLYRLFDTVDDVGNPNDPIVDPVEYQRRLTKHRRYILDVLLAPDILAVQEVENIEVLIHLATEIAAADGNVHYTPYLIESFDYSGMDNGFLVRDTVSSAAVTQLGAGETLVPEGHLLHDRPPLLLECSLAGRPYAILGVHLRSLSGVDDPGDDYVRRKRLQQSTSVAGMVQDHQSTSIIPMIVIGDFNAFQFTDGYVDVMGQIRGVVDPDDTLMTEPTVTEPLLRGEMSEWLDEDERYSYVFEGTAETFDHALTTTAAQPYITGFSFGRGNADGPGQFADDDSTATAASDHDGLVLYVSTALFVDGFESGDTTAWSSTSP